MAGPWECYAHAVGGCSERASREHYLSRSVLKLIGSGLIVQGLPGVPDGERIGVDSLATKILCDAHNAKLSPLDAEAARAFGAIQRFDADLRDTKTPTDEVVRVSGYSIERWLLKIAFGLAAANARVGAPLPIREQGRMLAVLFGRGTWPRKWGMYVGAKLGDTMAAPSDLAVVTGVRPDSGELRALTVWIRFLPLVLALGEPNLPGQGFRPGSIVLDRPPEAAMKTLQLRWGDRGTHRLVKLSRTGSMNSWAQLP